MVDPLVAVVQSEGQTGLATEGFHTRSEEDSPPSSRAFKAQEVLYPIQHQHLHQPRHTQISGRHPTPSRLLGGSEGSDSSHTQPLWHQRRPSPQGSTRWATSASHLFSVTVMALLQATFTSSKPATTSPLYTPTPQLRLQPSRQHKWPFRLYLRSSRRLQAPSTTTGGCARRVRTLSDPGPRGVGEAIGTSLSRCRLKGLVVIRPTLHILPIVVSLSLASFSHLYIVATSHPRLLRSSVQSFVDSAASYRPHTHATPRPNQNVLCFFYTLQSRPNLSFFMKSIFVSSLSVCNQAIKTPGVFTCGEASCVPIFLVQKQKELYRV